MRASYKSLLSPLKLRNLTIRNRVFSAGHAPSYAVDGKPKERYVAYHREKAKGGIGLTTFGGSSNVARDSGSLFCAISVSDDSIIPYFRTLSDAVHDFDTAIFCQITHMGRHCRWDFADPHILNKLARGDEDRIRPCVGAGYCLDRPYRGLDALCIHNPSTSRELTLPHETIRAPKPKRAVVVGGGPAGMEAARVLAERGHEVILFEALQQLGGQLNLAAMTGWRQGLVAITDWLTDELDMLGVDVQTGRYVDASEVLEEKPDIVILATGGLPIRDLPEGGGELTLTAWDFLGQPETPKGKLLFFDQTGAESALSSAQYLADSGAEIVFATPDRLAGYDVGAQNLPVFMRALLAAGTEFKTDRYLLKVERSGAAYRAHLRQRYLDAIETIEIDAVVVDQGVEGDKSLLEALAAGSRNAGRIDLNALADMSPQPECQAGDYRLFQIGDAYVSRNVHAAIYDARRLCRVL
ncbi:MAG: FAD-dependent oxidoreductase [Gammaproteobacteria bacterium]|nr:FAD-dependent oxidoreductase [Gammaproteobacteria bacterium]